MSFQRWQERLKFARPFLAVINVFAHPNLFEEQIICSHVFFCKILSNED